jgi:hypothetical protein
MYDGVLTSGQVANIFHNLEKGDPGKDGAIGAKGEQGIKGEVGKDGNIVISEGDILDMRSSNISMVMIQGRIVSLTDKHKQLYERYKYKYDIT